MQHTRRRLGTAKRVAASSLALVLAAGVAQPSLARIGESPRPLDRTGAALAYADFDGDSCEDLAVGVPAKLARGDSRSAGVVEVLYGRGASCRPTSPLATLRPPVPRVHVQDFGTVLAAGDFDRDGFGDLAVTATLLPEFLLEVFVLRGSASGLTPVGAVRLSTLLPRDTHAELLRAQALSVADFDADGGDDLAIAASVFWHYEIVILFGRGSRGEMLEFALARGRFEASGATDEALRMIAGDFDNNGFDDLAVARPDATEVRFHYAGPETGLELASWRTVTRLVPEAHTR